MLYLIISKGTSCKKSDNKRNASGDSLFWFFIQKIT